jgi:hypothetical protein
MPSTRDGSICYSVERDKYDALKKEPVGVERAQMVAPEHSELKAGRVQSRLFHRYFHGVPSKLRNRLELANHPVIGTGRHEHNEVLNDVLLADNFSAIEKLKLIFGRVVQLHHVALRRIEHGSQFVILCGIALAQAGAALAQNSFSQACFRVSGERAFQGINRIVLQSLRHTVPRKAVITENSVFR